MKKGGKSGEDSSTGGIQHRLIGECLSQDDINDCYSLALGYLEHRQRSEAEVRRYLQSKNIYSAEVIATVIKRLRNAKLINDREFAQCWKNDRLTFKPRSRSLIKRELIQKGVDPLIIDEATSGVDDLDNAFIIAKKRAVILARLEYPDFYRRLAGYLGRRGYSGEVVNTTVKKVWQLVKGKK